jgi:glycosyltransferase involved in cell wall biosynthesis
VLVLSPIPEEGAGCRFRIAQFIPYLEAHGFEVTLSALYTTEFFRRVYKPGQRFRKAVEFGGLSLKRLATLRGVSRFDVVFIYRELFPIGPAIVERLLSMVDRTPIVFDFDDAVFLPSVSGVSEANRFISAWKFPGKFATIIGLADQVIAGNEYLASYARRLNPSVTVIPTCVDTNTFAPSADREAVTALDSRRPIVGWIGSPTTALYIRSLADVLRAVSARHPFVLRISGTGEAMQSPGLEIENPRWTLDGEVRLFNTCDIGVYPLPDDEWAKGKCGFKAIEFMACGVPVVAAAVGVNREIIEDGVNGFLASSDGEWIDKIERLIVDLALRARFSAAGRQTIEARFSLAGQAPRLAAVLRTAAARGREAAGRR